MGAGAYAVAMTGNTMKHAAFDIIVTVLAAMALAGCSPDIKALGNDHASIKVELVTPWGTQRLSRVNPGPGQTAEITPDGTIRTTGTK